MGRRCKVSTDKILKKFLFPSQYILDATTARKECENYCATKSSCWGCSIDCNHIDVCQFNAINQCDMEEDWPGLTKGDITQKPGRIVSAVVTDLKRFKERCELNFKLHLIYIFIRLACLEIRVVTRFEGQLIDWMLGPCSRAQNYVDDYTVYVERCCIAPGIHTLTCVNKAKGEGWKNGYIEIQGHRYCDDFMSYRAMRKVEILGTRFDMFVLKILRYI